MKRAVIGIILCAAAFIPGLEWSFPALEAQAFQSLEFRNQQMSDILLALAEARGASILPDETVRNLSDTASFRFSDMDFDESLSAFLAANNLYQKRDGNIIHISRIYSDYTDGLVTLRCNDVPIESLVKALARTLNTSIVYDPLPEIKISVDIAGLDIESAIAIIMLRLHEYELESGVSYYYIRHRPANLALQERIVTQHNLAIQDSEPDRITVAGDRFSAFIVQSRFSEVLIELFSKAGLEYSLFHKSDALLENLHFNDKSFDELLRLLLEQGNADYVLHEGVYYITELQRRDVLKKLKQTELISLHHIFAHELPGLLPPELGGGNFMKVDKNTNTVLLSGTPEEINPIKDFIALIDRPLQGMEYHRFDLKYLDAKDAVAAIPPQFFVQAPALLPGINAFAALGSPENLSLVHEYVSAIDRQDEAFPVQLRYIKTVELLKSLPPSVTESEVSDSGFPNMVFFKGTVEKRELFLRELMHIDRPKPQIRYELLVIEYSKNNETRFGKGLSVEKSDGKAESGWTFLGSLSNIMSLSFDVVSQFGYQYASSLSMQLGENSAKVYADTTLHGLSGQEIRFQNTDTYRYRELEADADTGKLIRSGVTREISSGLIVALNGWVSGDNMITISVNATVSKQNNNTKSDASAIPSTSERIINTHIRTPSGKPIVLSGLMKETVNENISKTPGVGDIPGLGSLFRDHHDSAEQTEVVIYIVPYLVQDSEDDTNKEACIEGYYKRLVEGYHGL